MLDTVIIGAGLAGLTCGRALQAARREVVLLDKSRGVGGRLATRRLHGTHADHGFRVWAPQHPDLKTLTDELVREGIVQPWGEGYAAREGGNAIAKYLARDLTLYRQHRVVKLEAVGPHWRVWSEISTAKDSGSEPGSPESMDAQQVVLALPAPQTADLLEASGWDDSAIAPIRQVTYAPCVTVMAGYDNPIAAWPGPHRLRPDPDSPAQALIKTIILDSSKRAQASPTVVVIHSTGEFATDSLSIDRNQLEPIAQALLQAAETQISGLAQPDWFQVHRWRYALVTQSCPSPYITLSSPSARPILCCGDWCQPQAAPVLSQGSQTQNYPTQSYQNLDAAYQSGQVVAQVLC